MAPIKVKVSTKKLSVVTYPGKGSAVWGGIIGTITNQTDLINYINGQGFVTAAALSPYITSATAASTYLTISNAASTYQPLIGFTAENVANKATHFATVNHALYPSVQAVKAYVDNIIDGVDYKQNVATVATSNVTLSGLQNINGVIGASGLSVLLIAQTDQTENGAYIMDAGAWVRRNDSNTGLELEYAVYTVTAGLLAGKVYRCNTTNITLGLTNLTFEEWNVAQYTNGAGLALAGNTFSIATGGVTANMLNNVTGTGSTVVLSTSPIFSTSLTINTASTSSVIRDLIGTPTAAAIYLNQSSPNTTNYALMDDGSSIYLNGRSSNSIYISTAATNIVRFGPNFQLHTPTLVTSGSTTTFTWTKPNNTGQTASTPITGFLFTTGSRQWATGAISGTQVEVDITSPTYSFVAPSTIAEAGTLRVTAATAGTNATITANLAAILNSGTASLKIGSRVGTPADQAIYFNAATPGTSSTQIWGNSTTLTLNGNSGINIQAGTTNAIVINSFLEQTYTNVARTSGAFTAFTWTKANSTNQTAGTNIPGFLFTTDTRQWATGAVTLQEEFRITAPTYSFVAASTMTNASTLSVYAPIAGTSAIITNAWAIRAHGNVQLATNNAGLFGLDSTATSRQLLTFTGDNIRIYGRPGVSDIYLDPTASSNNGVYIKSSGSVGFGVATPTAWLHLRAGAAGTSSAPLKFTSGTNQTTAESGTIEYNGRFFMTESDNVRRNVVLAASATKTTAAAPYTNDGFIEVQINGSNFKLMTTA